MSCWALQCAGQLCVCLFVVSDFCGIGVGVVGARVDMRLSWWCVARRGLRGVHRCTHTEQGSEWQAHTEMVWEAPRVAALLVPADALQRAGAAMQGKPVCRRA